ncbi:MAG: hypothetical protein HY220_02505 [Candidatus Sungbacteria bacterium]|uniref:Uncharacterized protein n=1 Tax=Candidatus Sungiibacteriota bacterium TaxID=2750080 RepID=A0A9D6QU46_9BACT|nr:hypothetical protein [Candidatus Sungbacteria bacterium]
MKFLPHFSKKKFSPPLIDVVSCILVLFLALLIFGLGYAAKLYFYDSRTAADITETAYAPKMLQEADLDSVIKVLDARADEFDAGIINPVLVNVFR